MNKFQQLCFIIFPLRWNYFFCLSADAAYFKSRFSEWLYLIFKIFVFHVFLKVVQPPILCSTMGNDFDEKKRRKKNPHVLLSYHSLSYITRKYCFMFVRHEVFHRDPDHRPLLGELHPLPSAAVGHSCSETVNSNSSIVDTCPKEPRF